MTLIVTYASNEARTSFLNGRAKRVNRLTAILSSAFCLSSFHIVTKTPSFNPQQPKINLSHYLDGRKSSREESLERQIRAVDLKIL
jgi:hypothetical protein